VLAHRCIDVEPREQGDRRAGVLQVSDYPLMTLEPDDRGTFIAVGSENGNTTILELSHHLIDLQRNEKNIFLAVRPYLCVFLLIYRAVVSNKTKLSLLLLLSPVETAGEVLFLVHGVFLFVSWPGYEKIAAMVVKLSK